MAPRIIGLRGRRPVGRRLSGVCRCGPAVSWCPSPPPSLSCDFGRDLQAFEESPFLTPLTHSPPPPVSLFVAFPRRLLPCSRFSSGSGRGAAQLQNGAIWTALLPAAGHQIGHL